MRAPRIDAPRRVTFDVLCAGEPLFRSAGTRRGGAVHVESAALLDAAKRLAHQGLRVGLATVLDDDRASRARVAEMTALGIDVRGVTLAPPAAALVVVDAAGGQLGALAESGSARTFEIPTEWSSQVLLLSGLSPVTANAAALCRAARRARREGTVVVLDAAGSLRQWAGRDARTIAMVLREADVVRCSPMELAVVGTDSATVRRAMRPDATLVVSDDAHTTATGPFGEVRVDTPSRRKDAGESCTVAVCAELARPRRDSESAAGRWHRVLRTLAP